MGPGTYTQIDVDSVTHDDIIIAVMGATGAGKSSFIHLAIGGDLDAVGHGLGSHTRAMQALRYCDPNNPDRRYVFIDTPGFDDTYESDTTILLNFSNWLIATYKRRVLLTGILFLHRISDNRMTSSALKNTEMFKQLCGDNVLSNTKFVTTMWNEVEEEVGDRREQELREVYWQDMIVNGSQIQRFQHTHESAWEILGQFTGNRLPLQLQIEAVDEGRLLDETSAGVFLKSWLSGLAKQFKTVVKWCQGQLRIASRNSQSAAKLQLQKRSAEESFKVITKQLNRLQVYFSPSRFRRRNAVTTLGRTTPYNRSGNTHGAASINTHSSSMHRPMSITSTLASSRFKTAPTSPASTSSSSGSFHSYSPTGSSAADSRETRRHNTSSTSSTSRRASTSLLVDITSEMSPSQQDVTAQTIQSAWNIIEYSPIEWMPRLMGLRSDTITYAPHDGS